MYGELVGDDLVFDPNPVECLVLGNNTMTVDLFNNQFEVACLDHDGEFRGQPRAWTSLGSRSFSDCAKHTGLCIPRCFDPCLNEPTPGFHADFQL